MAKAITSSPRSWLPPISQGKILEHSYLALAIAMRVASAPTANLSFLALAAYALTGRAQAIKALALSWFFTMLSPGIAAEATQASVGRYAVILGAAISVFARSGVLFGVFKIQPLVMPTIGLGGLFVFHSLFFSPMADVSILKAVSWTVAMTALISAWQRLSVEERDRLARQLFYGLVLILLFSLPLVLLPVGYLRNGSGFQGILNHPQVFGPTMALLGAWAASQLFAETRPRWLTIALAGAAVVLIILSEARTAGLAMVIGVAVAIVSARFLSGKPLKIIMPGLRRARVWLVLGGALFLTVAFAPRISNIIDDYISKSGRAGQVQSVLEAYDQARGRLIDEMWVNIKANPFTGIGFGIGSNPYTMQVERDPVFGLPVSASIEKGVLPVAVLEEVGILGAVMVAVWFVALVRRSARHGVTPLAVTTTVLLLNMGESTFFSPGGMGLLTLVLIAWAGSVPRLPAAEPVPRMAVPHWQRRAVS